MVAQPDLKHAILLYQPPKFWDYKHAPLLLASNCVF
jgi:hypothetical protein